MRLLITDLDNTLYDWVTYFAHAFRAMVQALAALIDVDEERLLDEFKAVHQRYGNSEQPFAILELPSVRAAYGAVSRAELLTALQPALKVFNAERDARLHLYPHVPETLVALRQQGTVIVGHTEAIAVNALYRLRRLGISTLFDRLYAPAGQIEPHPEPARTPPKDLPAKLLRTVPRAERKPNPALLRDICQREGVAPAETFYVGDSLIRDISMAKAAAVVAVWARYGTRYERSLWNVLVRVTHWTDEDVRREDELQQQALDTTPDYVIDDFSELLKLVEPAPTLADDTRARQ